MDGADINHYSKKFICKDKIRGSTLKTEQNKTSSRFHWDSTSRTTFYVGYKIFSKSAKQATTFNRKFFHNIFKSAKVQTTFNSFFFSHNGQESINLNEEAFKQNISFYCIYSVPGNSYTSWRTQRRMFLTSFKVGGAVSSQLLSLAGKLYSLSLPGS